MKRYSKYKDSGIDWICEIPEHWNLIRLKYLFQEVNERTDTGFETLLSMSKKYGLIPQSELTDKPPSASTLVGYKLCKVGQIVMNKMQAWNGMFALVNTPGIVSPDYTVFQHRQELDISYYIRLFTMPKMIDVFHQSSKGLGTGFFRLYTDEFNNIFVVYPPLSEQKAIAQFLDRKLEQINHFISNKQRLIELLKEQKTAIANRAVTKGLNLHTPMKPSGIEWLEETPAHWEVKKLKYCVSIRSGQVDPKKEQYQNMILIAPNHIEQGTGKLLFTETVKEQGAESGKYIYSANDILYSKIRPNLKKACLAVGDGLCSADMYAITPNSHILLPKFLLYLLLTESFTQFAIERSMRVAMPKINREDLGDYFLAYPSLKEQVEILTYIEALYVTIDQAIAKAEKEIELIQEYRTTLISDAVTGKIDVRDTSAAI